MDRKILSEAERLLARERRRRIWKKIVSGLAVIVVFCTTYALILPAITQETEVFCGLEEHTHTEECYAAGDVSDSKLVCSLETLGIHTHTSSCYDANSNVICGYADYVIHAHDASCYDGDGNLICSLPEIGTHVHTDSCYTVTTEGGHTHTDACYGTERGELICTETESEGHTHGDNCYEETTQLTCTQEESEGHTHGDSCYEDGVLVCSIEESEGHSHGSSCYETTKRLVCTKAESAGHQHSDACYAQNKVLICGQEEQAGTSEKKLTCTRQEISVHTHSSSCYTNGTLTCGKLETQSHSHTDACYETADGAAEPICGKEEHVHNEACYADKTADVETAEDWEGTLANVQLTGDWAQDVLAVAKSQLGYTESTANYIISEEGRTLGYSRYGAWYGNAYGDWCAMFVSFCLHYAEVENVPYESSCGEWIQALSSEKYGMYAKASAYSPKAGDIIFFEFDGDGAVDHVGLVAEVIDATETESAKIRTIEGNSSNKVQYVTYAADSSYIFGYGILPEPDSGFVCGLNDHTHDIYCYGAAGQMICVAQEHTHTLNCLDESARERVEAVIALIDAMPSADEIDAKLLEYEEAEDYEGEEAWYTAVVEQVYAAYQAYSELTDAEKSLVSNADKLLELEYIWSTMPLITGISSDKPTTVTSATTSEFVELNLYDYGSNINTKYNENNKYPGFQWNGGAYKKDSAIVTTSSGTFVDRNLIDSIDFGNSLITDFSYGSSSSGSNGKSANAQMITASGTGINDIDINDIYGVTNRPIGFSTGEEVVSRTLGSDGYPALADGTSLSYLFSDGAYAKKQNTTSIDGLFQQNAQSGEYSYNSRLNHAQYSNNKFTLYNQIITPNFITYPFGNFLPFNDITNGSEATQVGKITSMSTYVEGIISDLKSSSGYSSNATKKQLVTMLNEYKANVKTWSINGKSWSTFSAKDAIIDYFCGDPSGDNPSDDTSLITSDLLNKMYNIDWDVATNFFFGMEMKMNFIQPKGGMTGNDNDNDGTPDYPMEFYFTGDDDVWVYVDDVLFLDLSGIHRHVGGKIDFVNGKVYYYYLDTKGTGDVSSNSYKDYTFKQLLTAAGADTSGLNSKGAFKDYTTHSFKFYYMERGSGSSVCRLNFNFPLLKQNSISVSKELSQNSANVDVLGNPDYKFQVLKANSDGTKTEELFIAANTSYIIYDENDNKVGTGTTDANGVFTLKAGQRAEFTGIKENAGKYYVRELLDDITKPQYGQITVSGETTTTSGKVTVGNDTFTGCDSPVKDMSDGSTLFKFNNQVTVGNLGSLEISKMLTEYVEGTTSEKAFTFDVTLDGEVLPEGTVYKVTAADGTTRNETVITEDGKSQISLKAGEKASISHILAGSQFFVQETSGSAKGYTVTYEGQSVTTDGSSASGTIKTLTSVEVKITNTEKGASVEIPLTKIMTNTDGAEHSYTFKLQQVTDSSGKEAVTDGTQQEVSIPLQNGESVQSAFTLNYLEAAVDASSVKYYYKITETDDGTEGTLFDTSVYIAEVTVTKSDTGEFKAELTKLWKDGTELTGDDQTLTFVNTLTQQLEIGKKVVGSGAGNRTYTFTVELKQGETALGGTFPAVLNGEEQTIIFDSNGQAEIKLGDGDSIVIKDIPYGAAWTVTEMPLTGYDVSYTINQAEEAVKGTSASGTIGAENKVLFINSVSYVLPETGGSGTQFYIMAGLLLIFGAVILLYIQAKRRKEVR